MAKTVSGPYPYVPWGLREATVHAYTSPPQKKNFSHRGLRLLPLPQGSGEASYGVRHNSHAHRVDLRICNCKSGAGPKSANRRKRRTTHPRRQCSRAEQEKLHRFCSRTNNRQDPLSCTAKERTGGLFDTVFPGDSRLRAWCPKTRRGAWLSSSEGRSVGPRTGCPRPNERRAAVYNIRLCLWFPKQIERFDYPLPTNSTTHRKEDLGDVATTERSRIRHEMTSPSCTASGVRFSPRYMLRRNDNPKKKKDGRFSPA